jgi:flavin reductase (DIM6/NTAB) family NADH-FMN oxidoreductase RutF
MLFNTTKYTPEQFYFLMIQTIIPRPIAWVLSDHGNGTYNMAPFSFFNAVAADPPIIMISVGWKDDATRKDTWVNIEQHNDFVVHIPHESDAQHMVGSSAMMPHGVSEIDKLGIKLEKMPNQRLPRVVGPKVAYFCKKYSIQEIGASKQALILGEVTELWLDDEIVKEDQGRFTIDATKINPVSRLGGAEYSLLSKPFKIQRPQ